MTGGRAGERGFTLVELLVSLAITAAAAGLLTATLGTARIAREHGAALAAASDDVAAAQGQVRERIGRLVEEGTAGAAQATTQGAPDRLSFLAAPPAARAPSGLLRYTLALAPDGTLGFTLGPRSGGAVGRMPLERGVRTLDLAYFGATPDDPIARWRAQWIGRADPPELVRVRVRFAAGDRRAWPDLVVAPTATANLTCTVDPTSGKCA